MTKQGLRELYKQKRAALTAQQCLRMNDLLLIQFQQMELPYNATVVLSYWPMQQHAEVNTFLLTDYLQFRIPGLQLAYPVANFVDHSMKIILVNNNTDFEKNAYGIAEPVNGMEIAPEEVDMVFVPLLAFDKTGHRLGYGKGFYDRFLPACRATCRRIGFSYFEPMEAIPGMGQFDVPLTTGITPENIYEF
jgi:5-formyltetrahydrofolate cyclo-ligase